MRDGVQPGVALFSQLRVQLVEVGVEEGAEIVGYLGPVVGVESEELVHHAAHLGRVFRPRLQLASRTVEDERRLHAAELFELHGLLLYPHSPLHERRVAVLLLLYLPQRHLDAHHLREGR